VLPARGVGIEAQPDLIVTRDAWLDRLLYVQSYPNVRDSLLVWTCPDPLTTDSATDVWRRFGVDENWTPMAFG
jgi:hypothetical protein